MRTKGKRKVTIGSLTMWESAPSLSMAGAVVRVVMALALILAMFLVFGSHVVLGQKSPDLEISIGHLSHDLLKAYQEVCLARGGANLVIYYDPDYARPFYYCNHGVDPTKAEGYAE